MGESEKTEGVTYSKFKFYSIGFESIIVALIIVVYFLMPGSCNTPINTWLLILSISLFVHIAGQILSMILTKQNKDTASKIDVFMSVFMLIFLAAWTGMGSWWIFEGEGCSEDWPVGYAVALGLLILNYVVLGLLL